MIAMCYHNSYTSCICVCMCSALLSIDLLLCQTHSNGSKTAEACQAAYCCNQVDKPVQLLDAGLYGLSNQVLDSPWAKVEHGKSKVKSILSQMGPSTSDAELTQKLMDVLSDETR